MKKSPAEEKQGQSVEAIFRDGFAHVEPTPPPRVWENLGRILDNQELRHYRRQLVWYRTMAAAVLLLLLSGALVLWQKGTFYWGQAESPLAAVSPAKQPVAGQLATKPAPVTSEVSSAQASPMATLPASTEKEPLMGPVSETSSAGPKRPKTGRLSGKPQNMLAAAVKNYNPAWRTSLQNRERVATNTGAGTLEETEETPVTSAIISQAEQPALALRSPSGPEKQIFGSSDSLMANRSTTILKQKQPESSLLAAGTATAATGQEEKKASEQLQRWSLAVAYSPQYAYSPVKLGPAQETMNASFSQPEMASAYSQAVAEYNESYTPTYSYSTMVGASYKINEKWQLESGLLYTQNEAVTHHSYVVSGRSASREMLNAGFAFDQPKNLPLVTNALYSTAPAMSVSRTDGYNTKYRYQQVGVPLRIAYRHNIKKLFAYVSGGVNLNLMVQNTIEPETDQIETVQYTFLDKESPFNVWQWATATSIGLGYDVSKNMSLIVAPEVTYSLTPLARGQQKSTEAYQLGVSIGGRWRLTK